MKTISKLSKEQLESEIIKGLASEKTTKAIAYDLSYHPTTIRIEILNLRQKHNVSSDIGLVLKAVKNGIIEIPQHL